VAEGHWKQRVALAQGIADSSTYHNQTFRKDYSSAGTYEIRVGINEPESFYEAYTITVP
jgi:hypothetical protein